ncbi:BTB domain-containing protein [Mycena sanguinolenta]|uniref:BTB domain-containing protein n=1 Tax=Mycena sanguinolenta TaxID=230812 RepID=A0A8H6Z4P9_9AGAR|nr:BTB domain-containing protein [Mycena sanguinolenta]
MSSSSPPGSMIRSEVWYWDGNVVLQASNTQFRVHWSVLGQHSSVFHDMCGLPQPPDQPSIDGCQIVELADDPQDVEYLLKALYIPVFHCQEKLSLSVIGAFIRLGRKYDFKYLLDSAVARVTAYLPSTLEEWDAIQSGEKSGSIDWEDNMKSATLDLITLASDSNIFSALPSAYYVATETWTPVIHPRGPVRRHSKSRWNTGCFDQPGLA